MKSYAPSQFNEIGLTGEFHKVGQEEWHGPCPLCGGEDRFVIWTDRPFPHWNFFCRVCHPETGWIDELKPSLKEQLPPEEKMRRAAEYAREREESLRREIERANAALKELQDAQAWVRYHEQLTDDMRKVWEEWGVPDFFQEYWQLGYEPARKIWCKDVEWTTPTMTIPIFEPITWECTNIRHRLMRPPRPGDKYRPEKSGLPQAFFVAEPDLPIKGKTVLVEGEKKAMVSFITADDPNLQVLGIPGKNMPGYLKDKLAEADPIYICLDPDATQDARRLTAELGSDRCRLIELPDKIDDLIIKHRLDKWWLRGVMRQAVRVGR